MRYVYMPVMTREKAKKSAIERLVATFFDGSVKAAAAAFLDPGTARLSQDDLKELERMIRQARKENK
jgi:predicted transcriptional regulator